jgi:hypoxanthine phosphoribosyltransferase
MDVPTSAKKEFIPYDTVRNNSLKLAYKIYASGFIPDIIFVSLRGGAYIGNVISEYFKVVRKNATPLLYAAVVARTYLDSDRKQHVAVDGWTYNPDLLHYGDRVLVVDDIFDSGKTINHLVRIILARGLIRNDVKVAVHDYKIRHYAKDRLPIHPDFYCRYHEVKNPEDDVWIHYLSHELEGFTGHDFRTYFDTDDPELSSAIRFLQENRRL